jgi:hypothetical protein
MAQAETTDSLDELLTLASDHDRFCLLIENWQQGLERMDNVIGQDMKDKVRQLKSKYGDNFAFRAFNADFDLHWNGEMGVVLRADDSDKSVSLWLISDEQQHPAAKGLRDCSLAAVRTKDSALRLTQLVLLKTTEAT